MKTLLFAFTLFRRPVLLAQFIKTNKNKEGQLGHRESLCRCGLQIAKGYTCLVCKQNQTKNKISMKHQITIIQISNNNVKANSNVETNEQNEALEILQLRY